MWDPLKSTKAGGSIGSPQGPIGSSSNFFRRKSYRLYFISQLLILLVGGLQTVSAGLALNEHILHFEPVFYDASPLKRNRGRYKRDLASPRVVAFNFVAHNREFRIKLKEDNSIFAEDVVFESTDGPLDFDFGKVYSGTLEDDDLVDVEGIITRDGIFDGHISTPNEFFYLEPANRYFKDPAFHSVMYKASDVLHPTPARCASQQLHLRGKVHNPWLSPEGLSEGAAFEPRGSPEGPPSNEGPIEEFSSISSIGVAAPNPKHAAVNFSKKLYRHIGKNKTFSSKTHPNRLKESFKSSRRKRSIIDPKKTTCMLYLQADHLFYREEGTEEACIDKITRHVQRVNNIYKVTDFDRDGKPDNIGFMIRRIKIHTENATKDPTYRFPGNYGVEKFLELFSEEDYDAFCLAYMFTYRDFEGGTLGLAWTGDLKNAGGVCERNGHYRGSLKSLNTGIVTLLNYGKKVPPAVSHVTLAHEIGHNFGSPHDPEKDLRCTPGGEDGNYIMFARATSGDKRNNNKFSPCSLKQINSVLNSKARDPKGCFKEPQRAICGNGVVEEGEECDCGWQEDCKETCCFPMVNNPKPHQKPCTLRKGKICSPSQGPCCTYNCHFKQGDLCRDDNGCRDAAFCDGRSSYCPPSINKDNKTICKEEFVCFKGECTGSICLAYGLESCQCQRQIWEPETKSCELCCKLPGENNPCLSSFDWNDPDFDVPDMFAKPGTPCDNYKGYCDVFQKCREVDPSGPLATLRKILLSNESLANLQRWIIEHWYVVLFMVVALVVILIAITRVFGKKAARLHSTSKRHRHKSKKKIKKKKVIVHKNSNTGGHFLSTVTGTTPDGTNHVVHPTVVRANVPFKRRVNEVRRAATKAKRVAKSQLGKPYKKSGVKRSDGGITSPTESEQSVNGVINGISNSKVCPAISPIKTREKVLSSRFSIISFKTCKPKVSSPTKRKSGGERRTKSKSKASHSKSRSPEKKHKGGEEGDDHSGKPRSRNPAKRTSLEDEKRKGKYRSRSPEKCQRSASPDKTKKNKTRSHDKIRKSATDGGNWLINKFLADEQKIAKPVPNGSLNGSPSGSPLISHRTGSTAALLPPSVTASPIRGIINEAFIGSPRGIRTHSSLRVTKSVSPEGKFDIFSNKYRRSISMETSARPMTQQMGADKRKRSIMEDNFNLEKKKRINSPEKTPGAVGSSAPPALARPHSIAEPEWRIEKSNSNHNCNFVFDKSKSSFELSKRKIPRRSSISLPSSANNSYSSVPDKMKEKLSLITASPHGSLTSILVPDTDNTKQTCPPTVAPPPPTVPPKDWV